MTASWGEIVYACHSSALQTQLGVPACADATEGSGFVRWGVEGNVYDWECCSTSGCNQVSHGGGGGEGGSLSCYETDPECSEDDCDVSLTA
eukprot:3375791-Rhodomonas_salina.1